jgi:hypothetical protein
VCQCLCRWKAILSGWKKRNHPLKGEK